MVTKSAANKPAASKKPATTAASKAPAAAAKPIKPKSSVIAIKVRFELNTPDGKRRVIFGLEKDTQGTKVIWKINFQLFERDKKTDPFGDPIVKLEVQVDKALNQNAEQAAKDGLTTEQSAHAIGPAADDAKAAEEGQLKPSIARQTVQDTIA
jgi:hypothetical protein